MILIFQGKKQAERGSVSHTCPELELVSPSKPLGSAPRDHRGGT